MTSSIGLEYKIVTTDLLNYEASISESKYYFGYFFAKLCIYALALPACIKFWQTKHYKKSKINIILEFQYEFYIYDLALKLLIMNGNWKYSKGTKISLTHAYVRLFLKHVFRIYMFGMYKKFSFWSTRTMTNIFDIILVNNAL